MPSNSHRLDALIAGASSKKAGPILRKVEKTSATPAGYRCFSSFWCKYHDSRGVFLVRDVTSLRRAAQFCIGGQDI
jgi:hypothetical protein